MVVDGGVGRELLELPDEGGVGRDDVLDAGRLLDPLVLGGVGRPVVEVVEDIAETSLRLKA
ncbi:MAG TPA: hypothetical protein V6D05_07865 [Stenomitos sp.]